VTGLRRIRAVMVIVALLLGLVACGGGSNSGASGVARQQGPAVLSKDAFTSALTRAQAKAGSAHIDAKIKAAGQSGSLSADVSGLADPSKVAMNLSLGLAGQHLQLVVLDKELYVKGSPVGTSPGKPWLKVNAGAANPLSKVFDSVNPANYIAFLNGITTYRNRGLETVDGVQTRHYTVTVDTAKMLARNPALRGQSISSLGLPNAMTSEVYVDSADRPVKLSVGLGSVASIEAHFSKYGQPVQISAPPADQVSEFSL
jgi:hypothetical protein